MGSGHLASTLLFPERVSATLRHTTLREKYDRTKFESADRLVVSLQWLGVNRSRHTLTGHEFKTHTAVFPSFFHSSSFFPSFIHLLFFYPFPFFFPTLIFLSCLHKLFLITLGCTEYTEYKWVWLWVRPKTPLSGNNHGYFHENIRLKEEKPLIWGIRKCVLKKDVGLGLYVQ